MSELQSILESLYWYDILTFYLKWAGGISLFLMLLYLKIAVTACIDESFEERKKNEREWTQFSYRLLCVFLISMGLYGAVRVWHSDPLWKLEMYKKSLEIKRQKIKNERYNEKHKHRYSH